MLTKGPTIGKKRAMLFIAGLLTCLVLFSKALDMPQHPVAPAKAPAALSHDISAFDRDSGFIHLFPCPALVEPTVSREVESESDAHHDLTAPLADLFYAASATFHTKKYLYTHLRASFHNRASVSLFVLYHCWKSFPG